MDNYIFQQVLLMNKKLILKLTKFPKLIYHSHDTNIYITQITKLFFPINMIIYKKNTCTDNIIIAGSADGPFVKLGV